mmetsp:Transcript_6294/g.10636  ORF Transcript_6294/g.10636 Transcript_6294/m.10636 type:complete len:278 (+) Transcript_6294:76-909(+)
MAEWTPNRHGGTPNNRVSGDNNAIVEDRPMSPAKKKLSHMVLGDGGFESLMKERSAHRREKEEQSLAQVMIQLTAAERALSTETQRRIESTHTIQKSCTQKIMDMEDNFQRILDERTRRMEERLVSVQEKVEELAVKFEEERETVPAAMERTGQELLDMVSTFQQELADERNDRLNREGRILAQMDTHATEIISSIEHETNQREQIANNLQERIATNEHLRAQNERDIQDRIQNELSELRGMIDKEKQERKMEDDDIVIALNEYTKQLQSSLSVISS